jgi:hypothetical protein
MQVAGLFRSDEVDVDRQGCCTFVLYYGRPCTDTETVSIYQGAEVPDPVYPVARRNGDPTPPVHDIASRTQ